MIKYDKRHEHKNGIMGKIKKRYIATLGNQWIMFLILFKL